MRYPCFGTTVSCRWISGFRSSGTAVLLHKNIHLKYSQLIVRKVLDAFLEEMVTVLSEGDTVKIAEYFKLEPKLYAGRKLNSKVCGNNLIIPEQYKPKMKLYKKLKEACKFLTKEDQHLKEEGA